MAGMTQKFGHEEISDGYLWYQWSEQEIAEYMDTVSSLNDAEDRAELGLISDAEPEKAGDFMIVEIADKKKFSKFKVLWAGAKGKPEGFDPDNPGDDRPVAINMGYYGEESYDDAPAEDSDAYKEDEDKYYKDGKWCVQAVAFFVGGGSVEDTPDSTDEEDEAGYMKEDEEKTGYTPSEKNAFICHRVSKRTEKRSSFGYGITTADKYVAPIVECSGDDSCSWSASAQKLVASRCELQTLVKTAENKLVYSNEDMGIKRPDVDVRTAGFKDFANERMKQYGVKGEADIPKNTLMVFENVVTTAKQDRDGDVLRSEGADIDPMMPLLWQHIQIEPIGKMVKVLNQSEEGIVVLSAIVDVNPLSQDAAKMVEAGMLRISHGFRPLEFRMLEQDYEEGKMPDFESPAPGFDIKKFEIMEESLVSVPANTDAVITMYSQQKFASPLAKSWAKQFYDDRPKSWKGIDPFEAKAEPDELKVGDYVKWGSSGGDAMGRITSIKRDGKVSVPDTSVVIEASKDDPVALIRIYKDNQLTDTVVGHKFSTLKKIEEPKSFEVETKDIDLSVSEGMIEDAKRALKWREEFNRGGTAVGVARANQIIRDKKLTPDTWRRMKAYFDRHQVDKEAEGFSPGEEGFPSAGRIAYGLWGGESGYTRSKKIVAQLNREEDKGIEDIEYKESSHDCGCSRTTSEEKQGTPSLEDISTERLASALCARLLSSDIPKDLGVVSKLRAVIEQSLPNVREALMDRYR